MFRSSYIYTAMQHSKIRLMLHRYIVALICLALKLYFFMLFLMVPNFH